MPLASRLPLGHALLTYWGLLRVHLQVWAGSRGKEDSKGSGSMGGVSGASRREGGSMMIVFREM
jgi:hypothetical protein